MDRAPAGGISSVAAGILIILESRRLANLDTSAAIRCPVTRDRNDRIRGESRILAPSRRAHDEIHVDFVIGKDDPPILGAVDNAGLQ